MPTHFSLEIFANAGVERSKLHIVGEPVDVNFFKPTPISEGIRVRLDVAGDISSELPTDLAAFLSMSKSHFMFLFVGKWENRKGVKILLRSFFKEFSGADGVCLALLTNAYHSTDNFEDEITAFLRSEALLRVRGVDAGAGMNPCHIVLRNIPQSLLPLLYSTARVLVRSVT